MGPFLEVKTVDEGFLGLLDSENLHLADFAINRNDFIEFCFIVLALQVSESLSSGFTSCNRLEFSKRFQEFRILKFLGIISLIRFPLELFLNLKFLNYLFLRFGSRSLSLGVGLFRTSSSLIARSVSFS